MKTERINLPVDAGNISIISQTLLNKYGLRDNANSDQYHRIQAKKNDCITVLVKGTWVGKVDDSVIVSKGETYYIGDACYFIKDWSRFLEDTNFMEDMPEGNASMSTGGDGEFEVVINPSMREMCEPDEDEEESEEEDNE